MLPAKDVDRGSKDVRRDRKGCPLLHYLQKLLSLLRDLIWRSCSRFSQLFEQAEEVLCRRLATAPAISVETWQNSNSGRGDQSLPAFGARHMSVEALTGCPNSAMELTSEEALCVSISQFPSPFIALQGLVKSA